MLRHQDIILQLFCAIADRLRSVDRKHPQGRLYLSEIVLCGVLFVLKGVSFRRFYHWLAEQHLFSQLPERSRLLRLIVAKRDFCNLFLASSTLFEVLDSFGVEMVHPWRENRSKLLRRLTRKGFSNHRWIVGRKLAITLNGNLEVVRVSDATANVHDAVFNETHAADASIVLTDQGFRQRIGTPGNFKICRRGHWNERMWIETLFSLWTRICQMKKSFHRSLEGFRAKAAYLISLTNIVVNLNERLGFSRLSLVQWSI